MTAMATIKRSPSPCTEDWKACAVPWKLVATVAGSVCRARRFTAATASPSETPGLILKEIVTEGSCPVCGTTSGPRPWLIEPKEESGASWPAGERT